MTAAMPPKHVIQLLYKGPRANPAYFFFFSLLSNASLITPPTSP